MEKLGLENNQISDVSALVPLTNLNELWLSDNQIFDVSALVPLTNLRILRLEENPLLDRTCPVQPESICRFE
ncbi:leucine-rich repeat domain-containing protein [Baaleninema simplex]|uniref:leucine-rich repeat domain-containing protein n=1 Tax=Baaleninema simplex TaxID=2862350 RepID=UPI000346AAEA